MVWIFRIVLIMLQSVLKFTDLLIVNKAQVQLLNARMTFWYLAELWIIQIFLESFGLLASNGLCSLESKYIVPAIRATN